MQPADLLTVDARYRPNGAIRVEVRGELDMYTAPALTQVLRLARQDGATCIELDLSGLSFIDVRGAHELVASECVLTHVPEEIRRILNLTFAPSIAV